MSRIFVAIAISALVAGIFTFMTAPAPLVDQTTARPAAKDNRPDISPLDSVCTQSWPYYQKNCVDKAKPRSYQTGDVRVAKIDRFNPVD
jgi:hypothetical protein